MRLQKFRMGMGPSLMNLTDLLSFYSTDYLAEQLHCPDIQVLRILGRWWKKEKWDIGEDTQCSDEAVALFASD